MTRLADDGRSPAGSMVADYRGASGKQLGVLISGLLAATIVAWMLRDVLVSVATLFPTDLPHHPYFVPKYALRLYLALPIAVFTVVVALLAPGMVLVLAFGGADRWDLFVLRGFAASFVVRVVLLTAMKLISSSAMESAGLMETDLLAVAVGISVLVLRRRAGQRIAWPLGGVEDRRLLLTMLVLVVVAAITLLPVVFWQDLTDDALEGLEIGRTLAWFAVPRFPNASGFMGLGIGMITMAYPVHWFVLLIGPLEAAVRLPLLLYLPLLLAALTALIETGSHRRLRTFELALLVLAIGVFVVTMGYNATYEPYAADLAAPTAFETLTVVCMLAAFVEVWRGQRTWFVVFAVMAYFARPTGLLMLLLVGAAAILVLRGAGRHRLLVGIAIGIGACLVANVLFERVYVPLVAEQGNAAFPTSSILARLRYLRFFDVHRVLYFVIPCGVVPAVALLDLRRQDAMSRIVTVVVLFYFAFFYVQAFVALHHFVPAMLLPLIVFWRLRLSGAWPSWTVPIAGACSVIALLLAVPKEWRVDRHLRAIGAATAYEIGDYGGSYAEYRESIEHRAVVFQVFPAEWEIGDPARELAGSSLGIVYYAYRARDAAQRRLNYVFQPRGAPAPPGFTLTAETPDGRVLVRDPGRWQHERSHPPSTDFQSRIYRIPRTTLFPHHGIRAHAYDVDLARLPVLWRLF